MRRSSGSIRYPPETSQASGRCRYSRPAPSAGWRQSGVVFRGVGPPKMEAAGLITSTPPKSEMLTHVLTLRGECGDSAWAVGRGCARASGLIPINPRHSLLRKGPFLPPNLRTGEQGPERLTSHPSCLVVGAVTQNALSREPLLCLPLPESGRETPCSPVS